MTKGLGIFLTWSLLLLNSCSGQVELERDSAVCIGFYNVENLFDTIDDKHINDNEFLPSSNRKWDTKKYNQKVAHLSKVLYDLGLDYQKDGAALIGLAEVENEEVVQDLLAHKNLSKRNFSYIHYDSPDKRGIDVALLYNASKFRPLSTKSIEVVGTKKGGAKFYTRDILKVTGILGKDTVFVFVNHWPSRIKGAKETDYLRRITAVKLRSEIKKITKKDKSATIIVMGDFNDNPEDASLIKHLGSVVKKKKTNKLYNPFGSLYSYGVGTSTYRGKWFLFDQVLVSQNLMHKVGDGYSFKKAFIFKPTYLIEQKGKYKGSILRTFAGGKYLNGYSDHLPVGIILTK